MSGGFWKPAPVSNELRGEGSSNNPEDDSFLFASLVSSKNNSSRRDGGRPSLTGIAQQQLLLPIYKHKKQILYAVETYDIVVIVGETGCGKSTQLPQYLVGNGWADDDFCVLCTQPRRIAAVTLAQRVAVEMNAKLGQQVGYSVRFQQQFSSGITQIKYVTDGMLLREATLADPLLSNYSVIIVDEAHERSLNSDAVLGLLKKIRRKRQDLKIIICSATIDAQSFVDFFVGGKTEHPASTSSAGTDMQGEPEPKRLKPSGRDNGDSTAKATIISVDGRQHSVDVLYLAQPAQNYIIAMVETARKIIRQEEQVKTKRNVGNSDTGGDILCFLPSGEEIDQAIRLAEEEFRDVTSIDFLPLYGSLPFHLQARVFQTNNSNNRRRIIFSTNIAETSVTCPNISHIIDSGLVKLPYFDPKTGLERLIVTPISQASARQRAGRAGRLQSGKCWRLYTEAYFTSQMQTQTPPEILRTNLTSFILTLKALGVDNILAFDLMDVPSVDALSHGLETLYALGAMDDRTQLTNLGHDMSCFPTDPRVSRMLLESLSTGCSWEVLSAASALQVRDLFHPPKTHRQNQHSQQLLLDYQASMAEIVDPSGDHVTYANLLAEMDDRDMTMQECKDRFINYLALKRAMEVRQQLSSVLRKFGRIQAMGLSGTISITGNAQHHDDGILTRSRAIRRCVTAGFFTNTAKLANDGRYYTLRKHILVCPSTSSSVFGSSFQTSTTTMSTVVSEYIVFGETLDGARGGIELKAVSSIEARWLRELAPHYWE